MRNINFCLVVWFCFLISGLQGQQKNTSEDEDASLIPIFRVIRKFIVNLSAEKNTANKLFQSNKKFGRIQQHFPEYRPFFCDTKNGPGKRSLISPKSVNEVRPGDIDIIAALGDSLSSGNGAISERLPNLLNENRGISFSGGGRADWRKYLTLPNILREFNNDIYGYSTEDCLTIDRASKFNVAEPIALFEDMLYQTQILHKRMRRDPKVNMTSHWKLITMFFGNNDFCSKLCRISNPEGLIEEHRRNLYETLRYIRDNIPKTIINWILLPNLIKLTEMKNIPLRCYIAHKVECPCLYDTTATPETFKRIYKIFENIKRDQQKIIYSDEFHTKTFTVNLQTFSDNFTLPILDNGDTDLRYFACDCFHFSQLGHAAVANSVWNNMMQPEGKKQGVWLPAFQSFECPTNERPFIATRENSKKNFSFLKKD